MALPPACWFASLAGAALCWLGMVAGAPAQDAEPLKIPDTQLEPLAWTALDGWAADDHVASFSAFLKSCAPFLASKELHEGRPIRIALAGVPARGAPAAHQRRGGAGLLRGEFPAGIDRPHR